MIAGALDIIASVAFLAAAAVSAVTVYVARKSLKESATVYLLSAMVVMTAVSVSNSLEHLGITSALDPFEDYLEVLLLPLLTYMLFRMHSMGLAARAAREAQIVSRLGTRLSESMAQMGEHRLGMLQALSAAVDARDHYTAQHSMHVADYACAIGYRLGMKDHLLLFEQAGLLHDIGKIGVPDHLLLKPSRLTDEEYGAIQRHVQESAHIIEAIPFLSEVVPLVKYHHERWDGMGYPDGLAGEDIPRAARVLAVADAFDAMTTDRPYRSAMSVETARGYLLEGRGTQFDPVAVDAMLQLIDDGIISVTPKAAVA